MMSRFTKQELRRLNVLYTWELQIGWNYERMQGLGYLSSMLPVIDRLYGDRPELKDKALRTHSVFFNTEPRMAHIIYGMDIAIEEQLAEDGSGIDVAASIKTALMGPFAGIGDTIYGMIAGAVFGSIAATFALQGSQLGTIIWVIWSFIVFASRFPLFDLGYKQGANLVTTLGGTLNALTDAAGVLGLTVVGGMIATMVKLPLATIVVGLGQKDPTTGEELTQSYNLQSYVDQIMPALLPAVLAGVFYWMLGQKWMNSNKLIVLVIVVAIVLAALGIVVY